MESNRSWVSMPMDDLMEFSSTGDPISFHYAGKDYFIEGGTQDGAGLGRVGSYHISDPDIQPDGDFGPNQTEYPNSNQYTSPDELLNAPFLDGKSILERFDQLRFFD
jgi:hypothetical protein